MGKFRIVPVIGSRIFYKTQVKGFFGWSDETDSNIFDDNVFGTITTARQYLRSKYGSSATILNYCPVN